MFRRLSEPLPLSEASLLLFRPALNAPVLNVGYLPIGPARAALVVFGEEYGGIGTALGVRASESGQLVVLRNQESIDFDVPLAEALEPLLAEAERMGFLFDEDMLEETPGPAGRARAVAHWADLMGAMDSLLSARSPASSRSRSERDDGPVGPLCPSRAVEEMQYPELMLDDVAPFELGEDLDEPSSVEATEMLGSDMELDDSLDGSLEESLDEVIAGEDDWTLDDALLGESDLTEPTAPISAAKPASHSTPVEPTASIVSAPSPAPPPARPPRAMLSKFRNPEGLRGGVRAASSPEVGANRSSELARIPIVRRKQDPAKRVSLLARLLSSF